MTDNRVNVRQLAYQFIQQNNPTGWFEELYAQANEDASLIPWADLTINPNLAKWLDSHQIQGKNKKALVIGCGLGDDAEALSQLGFDVAAFDISSTAITWCKKRFPDSRVDYCVADLFNLIFSWDNGFDFVLESYTLQALPAQVRKLAIANIVRLVAPQGKLLVICRGRDEEEKEGELPWPLTKQELSLFETLGLKKISFEDYFEEKTQLVRRFRTCYIKL
jgi:ubiquinone/menaquinone biosynthesis C-methylase UbiE